MPTGSEEQSTHEDALRLIRGELDKLKATGLENGKAFRRFVFLVLAENSKWETLRKIIVDDVDDSAPNTREKRTGHGAKG